MSRLKYGLSTICMVTSQRRRLDGFYCRCLRKTLRIPSAYISRVRNADVLKRAGATPFSSQLLHRQLTILGKVASSPVGSALRRSTFIDDTLRPQIGRYIRRQGRPRLDWYAQVEKEGIAALGRQSFGKFLKNEVVNRKLVLKLAFANNS